MTMLSTNHNSSLSYEDLENFSPLLIGWRKYFFTGSAVICVALAYLVQRAVHRSLKQLGTRPINQMIIPSQVNMNTILTHLYLLCPKVTVHKVEFKKE